MGTLRPVLIFLQMPLATARPASQVTQIILQSQHQEGLSKLTTERPRPKGSTAPKPVSTSSNINSLAWCYAQLRLAAQPGCCLVEDKLSPSRTLPPSIHSRSSCPGTNRSSLHFVITGLLQGSLGSTRSAMS